MDNLNRVKKVAWSIAISALLVNGSTFAKNTKDDGFSDIRIGNFTYHYSPRYNIPQYNIVSETGLSEDEYKKFVKKLEKEQQVFYYSKQKKGQRIDFKNTPACKPENNPLVDFKNSSGFVCKVPLVYALYYLTKLRSGNDMYVEIPRNRNIYLSEVFVSNIGLKPVDEPKICKLSQEKIKVEGCSKYAQYLWGGSYPNKKYYQQPWLTVNTVYDYLKTGKLAYNPILETKK